MIKFHVYKEDNQVVAHSLTADELEDKIKRDEINLSQHQIQPVEFNSYTTDEVSYWKLYSYT